MADLLTAADRDYVRESAKALLPDLCSLWRDAQEQDAQGGFEGGMEPYAGDVQCRLTHRSTAQREVGGAIREVEQWTLTLPFDQQIRAQDRVTIDGRWFHVISVSGNTYDTAKRVILGRVS